MKYNETLSKILASTMILSAVATPVSASSWFDKLGDSVGSLEDIVADLTETVTDAVESTTTEQVENFLEDVKDVIVEEIAPTVSEELSDWYHGSDSDESDEDTKSGADILEEAFESLLEDVKSELEDVKEQLEDSDFEYAEQLEELLDFVTNEDNQDKIEEAVETVVGAVVDVVENIDQEDVQNVVDVLEELVNGEGALSEEVLDKLGLDEDELSDLKDFYEANKEDLDDLRDYVSETYKEVAQEIEDLDTGVFDTAWEQLEDSFKELAGGGESTALTDTLTDLAELIEKSVEVGIKEELFDTDNQKELAEVLNQMAGKLAITYDDDETGINDAFINILDSLTESLLGEDGSLDNNHYSSSNLEGSLGSIFDILSAFVDAVEAEAAPEIDNLNTSGGALVEEFNQTTETNKGLFGTITGFFKDIFNDINDYIDELKPSVDNEEEEEKEEKEEPEVPTAPTTPKPPVTVLPEVESTPSTSTSSKETVESAVKRTVIYHENGCVTIILTNDTTDSLRKITRMPDGVVILQTYKDGVVYVSVTGVKGDVELYLPYDVRPLSTTKVLQSDVDGNYHELSSDLVGIYDDCLTISVNKNFSLQIHDSYVV